MLARNQARFGMGRVFLDAATEAQRRGDRRVGTEHIALAMFSEADSDTGRALGVGIEEARAALHALDCEALATLGIDAPEDVPSLPARAKRRLPLTPAGRAVFTGLRRAAAGERLGRKHVLLVLLAMERPDPAGELFDALHIDRDAVRDQLADAH